MKTEEMEIKRLKKQAFPKIWFLKKQTDPVFQEHNLKGLILQEHYLWGHKSSLACSKKCSNPFRIETWETIATYPKSAQLWQEAVWAVLMSTLIENQASRVNSGEIYSQEALH